MVDEVPKAVSEYMAKLGRSGGEARKQNLTPEQRSKAARKAVKARWAKAQKKKKS